MAIKKKPPVHGGDEWRIAYIDLLTNVLIFFIMAFSLSIVDVERLKMFSEYFATGKATSKAQAPSPKLAEYLLISRVGLYHAPRLLLSLRN